CEVARALHVTQKTAWFMLHRIRHTLHKGSFAKLTGEVEADETFIGGLGKNKHKSTKKYQGTGGSGKAIVMGLLERKGRVHAQVIANTKRAQVQGVVRKHVTKGSEVFTDAWLGYTGLNSDYVHQVIDHAISYCQGKVHTNRLGNFWSLLKRSIRG